MIILAIAGFIDGWRLANSVSVSCSGGSGATARKLIYTPIINKSTPMMRDANVKGFNWLSMMSEDIPRTKNGPETRTLIVKLEIIFIISYDLTARILDQPYNAASSIERPDEPMMVLINRS
jgi:hypothetical protein